MSHFSIFGANGFVGARLCSELEARGHELRRIFRDNWPSRGTDLGHVIFTIGMTADFRTKPFETVESQVGTLSKALQDYRCQSFLALSSTRIYRGANSTAENARLSLAPDNPDDLYNATKLAGEALCLALPNPKIRVARLSNLYGWPGPSQSFLASVLDEAVATGHVHFRTGPASVKDYLDVESAVRALIAIAEHGQERLYNVASGRNVSNGEIAAALEREGVRTGFEPGAPEPNFPSIDVSRLQREFGITAASLIERLPLLLKAARS
jgi:nucleoside-diphosphate-sugar epimerase